jgi:hypothetical protein
MNDNYLWDRSGEPDANVRELEELLGTLKYQPQPLQIPPTLRAGRKRTFIPLAIAAALALVMIGAGLWLHFPGSHDRPAIQAKDDRSAPAPNQAPAPLPPDRVAISNPPPRIMNSGPARKPNPRLARNNIQHIRSAPPQLTPLTEQELAQRDQVLIALRLASVKLNLAQRRMQTPPQANTFRN